MSSSFLSLLSIFFQLKNYYVTLHKLALTYFKIERPYQFFFLALTCYVIHHNFIYSKQEKEICFLVKPSCNDKSQAQSLEIELEMITKTFMVGSNDDNDLVHVLSCCFIFFEFDQTFNNSRTTSCISKHRGRASICH